MLIIKRAMTQKEYFGLMHVRCEVFVKEQHVDPTIEIDDVDGIAKHYIALSDDMVVGTCRIDMHDSQAKLGRMAILKEFRHRGIASQLIRHIETQRSNLGFQSMLLAGQLQAIPFYESCGFHEVGEVFLDADIDHKWMVKYYG